jgi:ABC-type phosphate transport system substrate-binding protein
MRELLRLAVVSSAAFAALGLIHEPEAAAQTVTCASLPDPIYVSGSSAVRPLLTTIGSKLAVATPPSTIVYVSTGSCDGVGTIVSGTKVTAGAKYALENNTLADCTLPVAGQTIDVGMSDVFPTSCPMVTADKLTGIGDFAGPVQSMNFVVPKAATQTTISAEAAYLTFGLGAAGKTDWDNPDLYAIRNFQSGTETMLALAIKVDTNKWKGIDKGGSGAVVTAIATATNPDKTIGILASTEADVPANRVTIKRLAFQPYGETCALYPDSTFSSLDKFNVRNGLYQVWGPVHMLANVNGSNVPTNPKAKQLLDILLGNTEVDGVDPVQAEIDNNTVPQCAMNVQRTSELGTPKAYSPAGACDCFFESKTGGASASCKTCTDEGDCTSAAPKCNRGYCEVK